jgi:hypothetical protein
MWLRIMSPVSMNVDADVSEDEVLIRVDGERVGALDRAFWDDWTARIDDDPETCLSACLASGEAPLDV